MRPAADLRTIAFYLPQFHPIPENDLWWGPGYTEWHRVVRGTPQYRGHDQPVLPGALGFYDLRTPDTRVAQAELAHHYGVDAFCYYHYWFQGHQLLNRPFDDVRHSGSPDFPFVLCWANESWTRAWDGRTKAILVAQEYSRADDLAHIEALLPAFADPRYVRVGGRPLFLVYRASKLPDPARTADLWRARVVAAGLPEPFLCRVESWASERGDPRALGFDGAVQFPPDWRKLGISWRPAAVSRQLRSRLRSPRVLLRGHRVIAYREVRAAALEDGMPHYPWWPCVAPSWDNAARRDKGAFIVSGSDPAAYKEWVRAAGYLALETTSPDPLLFVNAWNEWGEGAMLEPTERLGTAYLQAHLEAVTSLRGEG